MLVDYSHYKSELIFNFLNKTQPVINTLQPQLNNVFHLRSDVTGNCLYSSASLVQVGNNSLMEFLRVLTSIELFNNAEFYSQHPCFTSVLSEHAEYFSSINNLLPMCVSEECLDTGCTQGRGELVAIGGVSCQNDQVVTAKLTNFYLFNAENVTAICNVIFVTFDTP